MPSLFDRFRGKRALVMGLGLMGGGVESVRFLHRHGAKILATDTRDAKTLAPSVEALRDIPVEYRLGEHREEDFKNAEVVIHSPAVRPDHPLLAAARARGAEVTQEMSLFIEACPAHTVIGITGSNGKTTTTALCYEMLRQVYVPVQPELTEKWAEPITIKDMAPLDASFDQVKDRDRLWLGGNIGTPLINRLDEMDFMDVVLLELSSFQLMDWHRFKPALHTGLITNITPNHLDWHKNFEEYSWAKQAIFEYWDEWGDAPTAIINADDPECSRIAARNPGRYRRFSATGTVPADHVRPGKGELSAAGGGGELRLGMFWNSRQSEAHGIKVATRNDLRLPGDFNWANAVGAAAVCTRVLNAEWMPHIGNAVRRFRGVEHRLEPCGETHGARIYNDSIATDPTATLAALTVFQSGIHLILGGASDKGAGYDKLARAIVDHRGIKSLYLQGPTAANIKRAIERAVQTPVGTRGSVSAKTPPIQEFPTFESACRAAIKAARQGDVVLMSPASTSFYEHAPGQKFGNFEERGKFFKQIVASLVSRVPGQS
ncbi:MAG: hypothetical protein IT462_03580 [Planctomycetes bacterium]|nr:hypothetical protein [Planctomycetota bacterium]